MLGGLCVIQAKRYNTVVGANAVRALWGVMEDKKQVPESSFATLGPATVTAPLRRRLAEVRRAGVVVFDRRDPAPVASVAAPVPNGSGTTVAAVSVVVPAGTSSPRAYEHVVSAAALAISRGLAPSSRAGPPSATP